MSEELAVPGHARLCAFPAHLTVELTTRCNLRCVFCALSHDPRLLPGGDHYGDLSRDALRAIQPFFRSARTISLNGHGESLLSSQLVETLRMATESGARTELTTNLTMLTDSVAAALVRHRLHDLRVSMHAASPDLYARLLRNGDLGQTLGNLRKIAELKKSTGSRLPRIRFHFVGLRQNIHELPAVVRLAARVGARRIQVLSLAEYPLVEGESLDRHPALIKRWIPRALVLAALRGILLEVPPLYARHALVPAVARTMFLKARVWANRAPVPGDSAGADSHPAPALQSAPPAGPIRDCHDLWKNAIVEQNGNVRPCCVIERSMGNLNRRGFQAIWDGAEYARVREEFQTLSLQECTTCILRGWTTRTLWERRHRYLQGDAGSSR